MLVKKLAYKRDIIKELYFSKALSCADLSERLEKSLPLITGTLTELIDEGYVVEMGHAPSTGGRRGLMYALKEDVMYVVSVAMDQFVTRIAIVDMNNRYVSGIENFRLPLAGNREAPALLAEKISEVIHQSGITTDDIIGIGVGMPGFVNPVIGVNYTFMEIPGGAIAGYLEEKLNLPVFIDNDSSLIALAECRFGTARHIRTAMVINIGWGIGLGLIINAELFRGENGFAGEFSHIPLFLNGRLCGCGKKGCLETESSLLVVLEKAKEGLETGRQSLLKGLSTDDHELAIDAIISAAGRGDQFAIELLSGAGYTIGRGVAILIHLFNPEAIILSGRGASPGIIWQTTIQQALNEHCIPRLFANTSIKISTLGYHAQIIGAAALVMEKYDHSGKKKIGKTVLPA